MKKYLNAFFFISGCGLLLSLFYLYPSTKGRAKNSIVQFNPPAAVITSPAMVPTPISPPPPLIAFLKQADGWHVIEPGLTVGLFHVSPAATIGDSRVVIVKIAPAQYELKLLTASEHGGQSLTAREWCEKYQLIGAINAGMFKPDYQHTGYMKNYAHNNNPELTANYNALLVFHPLRPKLPDIQLLNLTKIDFAQIKDSYASIIQNMRLLKNDGTSAWPVQEKRWSMALLGIDQSGNILMIFCRSPYSVHDLVSALRRLPLELQQGMYLEGGPETSLFLHIKGIELELYGCYETGFNENDDCDSAWPIPNVIGVVKKGS